MREIDKLKGKLADSQREYRTLCTNTAHGADAHKAQTEAMSAQIAEYRRQVEEMTQNLKMQSDALFKRDAEISQLKDEIDRHKHFTQELAAEYHSMQHGEPPYSQLKREVESLRRTGEVNASIREFHKEVIAKRDQQIADLKEALRRCDVEIQATERSPEIVEAAKAIIADLDEMFKWSRAAGARVSAEVEVQESLAELRRRIFK